MNLAGRRDLEGSADAHGRVRVVQDVIEVAVLMMARLKFEVDLFRNEASTNKE